MTRTPRTTAIFAIGLTMAMGGTAGAQTFKVEKYNIGGEGGTDYIDRRAGTRPRLRLARHARHGGRWRDRQGARRHPEHAAHARRRHGAEVESWLHHQRRRLDRHDVRPEDARRRSRRSRSTSVVWTASCTTTSPTGSSSPITAARSAPRWRSTPNSGDIVGTAELEDNAPEGAASDGKGRLFVNNESKNTIQVLDAKTMKVLASWPIAPCDGPTGIAYDDASDRIFSGCSKTSVVVDAKTGKVVATIANGDGVDALGWDPAEKLIYIPPAARRQRDGRAPGFAGQVHGGRHGADARGRQDDRGGSGPPHGVSLPARVRPSAAPAAGRRRRRRRGSAAGARADRRRVVHRNSSVNILSFR